MQTRVFSWKIKKTLRLPIADQKGQSIVIFAFAVLGLIALLGLALDLGLVYIERTRLKRAVDASTLAAVSELSHEEKAYLRAINYLDGNGYNLRSTNGNPLVNIYIRGCAHDGYLSDSNYTNYHENNAGGMLLWTPAWSHNRNHPDVDDASKVADKDKYYLYFPATQVANPSADFFIDTRTYQAKKSDGSFEDDGQLCDSSVDIVGTADKIHVEGVVPVGMNFMQFFGFSEVPVSDSAIAQNVTSLDVAVVFDISGSMQYDTICHGCYEQFERPSNPNKGSPIDSWEDDLTEDGDFYYGNDYPRPEFIHPIPVKHLPSVNFGNSNSADLNYAPNLQAVLGAPNNSNTGKLCWQRGPGNAPDYKRATGGGDERYFVFIEAELYSLNTSLLAGAFREPGRGYWAIQHTNWRAVHDMEGIGWDPDDSYEVNATPILDSYDRGSWVSHHPYVSWAIDDVKPFGHDYTLTEVRDNPLAPPSLEYDFITHSDWDGTGSDDTRIWIRSQRGSTKPDTNEFIYWAVYDYDQLYNGPANGNVIHASITPLGSGQIEQNAETTTGDEGARYGGADGDRWRWRALTNGSTSLDLDNGKRYVLKLWAGSPGYDIDQIVVGNQNKSSEFTTDYNSGAPAKFDSTSYATPGSAFRQACNRCNIIYGLEVDPSECQPPYDNGVVTEPVAGSDYDLSDPANNPLFGGYQPIRDSKEAVKRFVAKLKPQFDQVGIVSYSTETPNDGRVELRCKRFLNADQCFRGTGAISYTEVLDRLEILPASGSTNIAGGMLKGLEMLGINPDNKDVFDNTCDTANPLTSHCSRGGAAKRIMIVMTDGIANKNPNDEDLSDVNCYADSNLYTPNDGDSDENNARDCVMYYAQLAGNSNVTIYTIGLGNGSDADLLEKVATVPGSDGEFFADVPPAKLDEVFDTILSSVSVRLIQ